MIPVATRHIVWRLALILASLLQAACAAKDLTAYRTAEFDPQAIPASTHIRDLPLRSGQIIVREAGSSMGFLMNLMAADYGPYGHAGIVVREPDGLFVYDAFSALSLQFWKPPTLRLSGSIRRIRLEAFLARGTVSAVYEHQSVNLDAVASYAVDAWKNRLAFDGMFDYRTPDEVYCAEFVAAALQAAGHDEIAPVPRTENPSLHRVMNWLELETPGFILAKDTFKGATRVARFSPNYSANQIDAHFAFERELHRRFTADRKLGHLFRWTRMGPRIQPHLRDTYKRVIAGADAAANPEAWAIQMIDETFSAPTLRAGLGW